MDSTYPPRSNNKRTKPPDGRNLVVCCDGTSNEIGKLLSNVLKLYRIAEKSKQQIVFYQPGIGTVAMPDSWTRGYQKARAIFEMATGLGVYRDVLNAYCFLARNYLPGDRIFLFGFSRGAYTVRVVAGMIYLIGLLRRDQTNFAGYAFKAYKSATFADGYALAREFREVVLPQTVPIRFVGVWDTVSSVIVPGRSPLSRLRLEELPHTSNNPAVQVFRHAIAIDEFRRMFPVKHWDEPQEFKPNRYSQTKSPSPQDVRQVWFPGCHSDVGGGYLEQEAALSKYPLRWMLEQAANNGLLLRTSMFNHMVLGKKRKNARDYTAPAVDGTLHKSLCGMWWPQEFAPKRVGAQNGRGRTSIMGFYLPRGEPRPIPPHSLIHISAVDRMKETTSYRPSNLKKPYTVESLAGQLLKPKISTQKTALE